MDFRSICKPSSLPIYLANELFEKISLSAFRKKRISGIKDLKSFINSEIEAGRATELKEVLEFSSNEYDNKRDFEIFMEAVVYFISVANNPEIYSLAKLFGKQKLEIVIRNYYEENTHIKNQIKRKLLLYSGSKNISAFLRQMIRAHLYEEAIQYLYSIEELKKIQEELFSKHLKSITHIGVIADTFEFYYNCVDNIADNTIHPTDKATKLFLNFIQKHSISYLSQIIVKHNPSDSHFRLDESVKYLFKEMDQFETFLKEQKPDEKTVIEVKSFYKKYKAANYNPIKWTEADKPEINN